MNKGGPLTSVVSGSLAVSGPDSPADGAGGSTDWAVAALTDGKVSAVRRGGAGVGRGLRAQHINNSEFATPTAVQGKEPRNEPRG